MFRTNFYNNGGDACRFIPFRHENDEQRLKFECKKDKLFQDPSSSFSFGDSSSSENISNEDCNENFDDKYDRKRYSAALRHILVGKHDLHEQLNIYGTKILNFNKSNKEN